MISIERKEKKRGRKGDDAMGCKRTAKRIPEIRREEARGKGARSVETAAVVHDSSVVGPRKGTY